MKQNERLLVYAVTGFLALILVIAVVFGNEPDKKNAGEENGNVSDLSKLLGDANQPEGAGNSGEGAGAGGEGSGNGSGLLDPNEITAEKPLVAKAKAVADLVREELGNSRRDRTVRFVRAKRGDSLETLVNRWCGSTKFAEEARYLNEDLRVLQVGQEVAVPWIDDEDLYAIIESRKPRVLAGEPANSPTTRLLGEPMPASARVGGPDFRLPVVGGEGAGSSGGAPSNVGPSGGAPSAGANATKTYVVKGGDSLWKIAAKQYGKGKADAMVRKILDLNPGLTPDLRPKQKIQLPVAAD